MRRARNLCVRVATGAILLGASVVGLGVIVAPFAYVASSRQTEEELLQWKFDRYADNLGNRDGETSPEERRDLVRVSPSAEMSFNISKNPIREDGQYLPSIMRLAVEDYNKTNGAAHFFDSGFQR